jgi:ATP-binding cassette, subfamily C, bacterial
MPLVYRSKFRDVVADVYSVHGSKLFGFVSLTSVAALCEGLSMALLLPLLSSIGVEGVIGAGAVETFVLGVFEFVGAADSVFAALALVLSVFAVQAGLSAWQTWWMADLQRSYGAAWQKRLFESIIRSRWEFVASSRQGELVNAILVEAHRLSGAFMVLAQTASAIIVVLVYVGIALALSWKITTALVAFAGLLMLAVRSVARKNYQIGQEITGHSGHLTVLVGEYISGIKLVKSTSTEGRVVGEVGRVADDLRRSYTWGTFLPGVTKNVFEFASIAALCTILVVGHAYLAAQAAHMLLILALFVRLLPRFNALQQNLQLLNSFLPSLGLLRDLFASATAVAESVGVVGNIEQAPRGRMLISGLCAGYGNTAILHNLDLEFAETGFWGVVGESGAGKSTFVQALLGFCTLQSGDIKIGRDSIRQISVECWRRAIGYVPQETILFNRSVRENISWGWPEATDAEIEIAARKAKAHDFIVALPDGYATVIGDQGLRLSGGQRQRLGIARALMGKPRLLILDEATSALDSASEEVVLATMEELRRDVCIISVAHRLSTVRNADQIIVLGEGRLVEIGAWDELIQRRGALHVLAEKQHMI